MTPRLVVTVDTLADLRAAPAADRATLLLIGKTGVADGSGGFYRFTDPLTGDDDPLFLNQVRSTSVPTGAWVRVFQRARALPQGTLVYNGNIKTLYAAATTNSAGEATMNLTMDGTPTGTAIFSSILDNRSFCTAAASGPGTAVQSYIRTAPGADLKTTTHGYFAANSVTMTVGLLYKPAAAVPAGMAVQFVVVGY